MHIILNLGLIILPFVYYEIPRVWFVGRWIEIILLIAIINLRNLNRKQLENPLILTIGLFLTIGVISSFFGVDWQKSIWGNYYRHDGLITFIHLISLTFILIFYWQESWRKSLSYSIGISSLVTSLLAIIDGVNFYLLKNQTVVNWDGAIGVSFGQPKYLTGYLLVTLPFLVYCFNNSKTRTGKYIWGMGIVSQIVAILLTKSLAGVLGISLMFCILLILNFRLTPKKFLTILFIVFFTFSILGIILQEKRLSGFVPESRERIIRKIILGVVKRPILGYGWSNADYAFEAVDWPMRFTHDVYVDKAHSILLEVLATTGILGFILYILLLVQVGKRLVIRLNNSHPHDLSWTKTLFVIFILYVFQSQTNVISIGEDVMFWLLLGIVGVVNNGFKKF